MGIVHHDFVVIIVKLATYFYTDDKPHDALEKFVDRLLFKAMPYVIHDARSNDFKEVIMIFLLPPPKKQKIYTWYKIFLILYFLHRFFLPIGIFFFNPPLKGKNTPKKGILFPQRIYC